MVQEIQFIREYEARDAVLAANSALQRQSQSFLIKMACIVWQDGRINFYFDVKDSDCGEEGCYALVQAGSEYPEPTFCQFQVPTLPKEYVAVIATVAEVQAGNYVDANITAFSKHISYEMWQSRVNEIFPHYR